MSTYTTANVDVFPSTYRKEKPYGKFTSEENFVNILNSICDKDGYVVDYKQVDNYNVLEVVIHGYFFRIKDFSPTGNKYLQMRIENGGNSLVNFGNDSTSMDEILDAENKFTGLQEISGTLTGSQYVEVTSGNYTIYKLQVCVDSNIVNRIRLSTNSVYYNSDTSTSLTSKIDSKQDNLSATAPIELSNNTVSLASEEVDKLDGLEGKGSTSTPVYFNGSGIASPITVNAGGSGSSPSESSISYSYTKEVKVVEGDIQNGKTTYYSTDSPDSGLGSIGDFWFKYNN